MLAVCNLLGFSQLLDMNGRIQLLVNIEPAEVPGIAQKNQIQSYSYYMHEKHLLVSRICRKSW